MGVALVMGRSASAARQHVLEGVFLPANIRSIRLQNAPAPANIPSIRAQFASASRDI